MNGSTSLWQGRYDRLFIGGDWVLPASGRETRVISPATEEAVATVPEAVEADVDAAVCAARAAFDDGPWPRSTLEDRIVVMQRLSALLAEHEADAAHLVTAEMGSPITLSTRMQSIGPRLLLDAFIEVARTYPWIDTRRSATGAALVTREPVGVVAAVVPWNAPLLIAMIKLAPALLAGCTAVLKPTPETSLDSYLLGDLVQRAGLPEGVLNIVPAQRAASEYLVSHPGVDKVSFTGSTAAGRRVGAICGEAIRRCTLELGGKSAAVVFAGADLDATVNAVRALSLRNTGQVCSNKTRIVAERSIAEEVKERLVAMVDSMPVGDPLDPKTEIGPVANANQLARVESYLELGKSEGTVLVGGGRLDTGRGYFVSPTIFADVDPAARIAQEEIFGPVLTVHTFDNEREAVAIANNSQYGLNGSVWTSDVDRSLSIARQIRTGTVEINGNGVGFTAPIGGFKSSGIGREAGPEGFDAYVEIKSYGLPGDYLDHIESLA